MILQHHCCENFGSCNLKSNVQISSSFLPYAESVIFLHAHNTPWDKASFPSSTIITNKAIPTLFIASKGPENSSETINPKATPLLKQTYY